MKESRRYRSSWRIPGTSGRCLRLEEAAKTELRCGRALSLGSKRRGIPLGRLRPKADFATVDRRRGRMRGGISPTSASLPASRPGISGAVGENSRAKGVASHGVGPTSSRMKVREDARGGANIHEECVVTRWTGKALRTTAPGTYAQVAAQPHKHQRANRKRRRRNWETRRNPVQVHRPIDSNITLRIKKG
jgi:hypothetical protein